MNESQAAKWAVIRSKGLTRYVWLQGVMMWGWPTAVIWTLVVCAVQGWDRLPLYLPIAMVCFSIGGYVAGTWGWARHEGNYQRLLSKPIS